MQNYILNYKVIGEGTEILFIPGWNDNLKHFIPLASKIKNYKFILVDLPNQGESKPYLKKLEMNDYIYLINKFLKENNFNPKIIIGHSFGGKIAFLYSLKYKIDKLVLVAPSLIKNKSLKTYFKIYKYKIMKYINNKFNLKFNLNKYGSKEYQNQKGIAKDNFIIATNNYYDKELKNNLTNTLLYYGKLDKVTPLKEAKIINKKLKNSILKIDKYGDHFAIYNNPYNFIKVLKEFLND